MIDHHEVGLPGVVGVVLRVVDVLVVEQVEVPDRLQDPAGAGGGGVERTVLVAGGVQQQVLGLADADAREPDVVHRQVVEGVTGDQHAVLGDAEVLDELRDGVALVDPAGQHVEVVAGGVEQVAADLRDQRGEVVGDGLGVAEVGDPSVLGHVLPYQARAVADLLQHGELARPLGGDLLLDGFDGEQVVPGHDRGPDVTDDEVGRRDGRVGEQRQHRLEPTTGDEGQEYVLAAAQRLVELDLRLRVAG